MTPEEKVQLQNLTQAVTELGKRVLSLETGRWRCLVSQKIKNRASRLKRTVENCAREGVVK